MNSEMYVIGHVTLITGFTDRTIRNYIANGMLKGEKINGIWHFSQENLEEFIQTPSVQAKIHSKNNALVYDFLVNKFKTDDSACLILDLPNTNAQKIMEDITYRITTENFSGIDFSYEMMDKLPRIILKGSKEDVFRLVHECL